MTGTTDAVYGAPIADDAGNALMAARQTRRAGKIMLIRHAEKPAKVGAPFGIDPDGMPDPESLSRRGWQRSGALSVFFAPYRGPLQDRAISVPDHLFACGNEKVRKRLRPMQTITLLAERLGTVVDTRFIKGEEDALADFCMGQPGVVLISWEHNNIHRIANRILGESTKVPQRWPDDRFDLVWVFELTAGSYRFSQHPQLLLPGDRERVI